MWDNTCTMHFAIADYGESEREIHRVTLVGERLCEAAGRLRGRRRSGASRVGGEGVDQRVDRGELHLLLLAAGVGEHRYRGGVDGRRRAGAAPLRAPRPGAPGPGPAASRSWSSGARPAPGASGRSCRAGRVGRPPPPGRQSGAPLATALIVEGEHRPQRGLLRLWDIRALESPPTETPPLRSKMRWSSGNLRSKPSSDSGISPGCFAAGCRGYRRATRVGPLLPFVG